MSEIDITYFVRYSFAKKYLKKNFLVLDAPCGAGFGCKILSKNSNHVVGIDLSKEAIKHSKKYFSSNNINYVQTNCEEMSKKLQKFDLIVSFEGIEHFKNPKKFLRECKKLLKKNGKIIISTPRKPHGNPFHIKEYDYDEFKFELKKFFKIKKIFGQVYDNIFDFSKENINPKKFKKFNFIAVCEQYSNKIK
ncbi:MAG: class I SAM-dependent methyltransferase [Candidatus ainarchaeum sp.]|nr:class I SAM-dependent methyltransferase [Candidatus ainarchaeum sp.]